MLTQLVNCMDMVHTDLDSDAAGSENLQQEIVVL